MRRSQRKWNNWMILLRQGLTVLRLKEVSATLQDQISCSFKGFVNRLNIQEFNEPQIGLSRLEQGSLVHKILENFFNASTIKFRFKKLT